MELEGKVAVITGAGAGLGRGLAHRLGSAGMKIVLSGPTPKRLEETASQLAANNVEALCVQADVSDISQVEALANAALDRFGAVHLLCNNAGVAAFGPIGDMSMDDWRWTISVNLWGPINGVQVFLPIMEKQGEGHICTTASESGLYGAPFLGAYNVSKFGVVGLMSSLERDLRTRKSPVSASVFCPSAMATDVMGTARNRPKDFVTAPMSEATQNFRDVVQGVIANGMNPDDAADFVVEGIRAGKFWIFSHPHVPETALKQATVMAEKQELIDL
ncbi:MAG: SDR family NAD(P)-dependent oxidoreductase [Hyphomicrobiales bacterium]|nr:SDR family NAD(P)-dependent oxidoreductase [Hyphomicrobiales bacterium]MCP5001891.1 SDR family NAD(P)-dependent oxidoreductase [Hyphomicrobiales bacterium]